MPTDFLLQQLQWREQLEEAQTLADVGQLLEKVLMAKEQALTLCETYLDVKHDWLMAAGQVRALMFMERFEEDVDRRQEQLEKA
jgi:molecular chaperone HscB